MSVLDTTIGTAIVIQLPELLSMIFERCPLGTLAACSRVQRSWEFLAYTELWRNLPSLEPVLRILDSRVPFCDSLVRGSHSTFKRGQIIT
jgi:hypothetical protein